MNPNSALKIFSPYVGKFKDLTKKQLNKLKNLKHKNLRQFLPFIVLIMLCLILKYYKYFNIPIGKIVYSESLSDDISKKINDINKEIKEISEKIGCIDKKFIQNIENEIYEKIDSSALITKIMYHIFLHKNLIESNEKLNNIEVKSKEIKNNIEVSNSITEKTEQIKNNISKNNEVYDKLQVEKKEIEKYIYENNETNKKLQVEIKAIKDEIYEEIKNSVEIYSETKSFQDLVIEYIKNMYEFIINSSYLTQYEIIIEIHKQMIEKNKKEIKNLSSSITDENLINIEQKNQIQNSIEEKNKEMLLTTKIKEELEKFNKDKETFVKNKFEYLQKDLSKINSIIGDNIQNNLEYIKNLLILNIKFLKENKKIDRFNLLIENLKDIYLKLEYSYSYIIIFTAITYFLNNVLKKEEKNLTEIFITALFFTIISNYLIKSIISSMKENAFSLKLSEKNNTNINILLKLSEIILSFLFKKTDLIDKKTNTYISEFKNFSFTGFLLICSFCLLITNYISKIFFNLVNKKFDEYLIEIADANIKQRLIITLPYVIILFIYPMIGKICSDIIKILDLKLFESNNTYQKELLKLKKPLKLSEKSKIIKLFTDFRFNKELLDSEKIEFVEKLISDVKAKKELLHNDKPENISSDVKAKKELLDSEKIEFVENLFTDFRFNKELLDSEKIEFVEKLISDVKAKKELLHNDKPENISSDVKPENISSDVKPENISSDVKPENISSDVKPENTSTRVFFEETKAVN